MFGEENQSAYQTVYFRGWFKIAVFHFITVKGTQMKPYEAYEQAKKQGYGTPELEAIIATVTN